MAWALTLLAVWVSAVASSCFAEDPYANFDWDVSFITAAPLGVKQQVPLSFSFLPNPNDNAVFHQLFWLFSLV